MDAFKTLSSYWVASFSLDLIVLPGLMVTYYV